MKTISDSILNIAFDGVPPHRLSSILNFSCCDQFLDDFKLVVVRPLQSNQPTRITWSAQGEEEYWLQNVLPFFAENHQQILLQAPTNCRKVIDTDGEQALLFLDDLHQDNDDQIMTQIYGPSFTDHAVVHLRKTALTPKPPVNILFQPLFMGAMALGGMWAERISCVDQERQSILWISEARWKQTIPQSVELIERCCFDPIWQRLQMFIKEKGGVAYPDVIEFFFDGQIELSIAFMTDFQQ